MANPKHLSKQTVVIGTTSAGQKIYALVDENGFLLPLMYGTYNGDTPTKIATDAEGRLLSSGTLVAHVDGLESLTQELIDLFKWERFDEIVEDGGYMYFGFRSRTDSTYRVKRIKDDTHAAAYCYGDGELPASAGWTGLVYA